MSGVLRILSSSAPVCSLLLRSSAEEAFRALALCRIAANDVVDRLLGGGSAKSLKEDEGSQPWDLGMAVDGGPGLPINEGSDFGIEGLLSPVMWVKPKGGGGKRRFITEYRKMRKWFGTQPGSKRWRMGMPIRGIQRCFQCGNPMFPSTLCPHCYAKVREETQRLQSSLGPEFRHRHPSREIQFVYEDEQFGTGVPTEGRLQIQVDRQRPEWFARATPNKNSTTQKKDTTLTKL